MVADRIIDEARRWLGTPYRRVGNGPKVFDCTGLTKYVYGQFGYTLGRTVPQQAADGREITGNLSDLQKGDILIFASRPNKRKMGHAGIFIGMDSTGTNFNFIHAARTGVIISNLKETYYKERFLGARRILPDFVPDGQADSAAVASLVAMLTPTVAVPDTLSLSPACLYLSLMSLLAFMMSRRWPSVMAPIWLSGNRTLARSTTLGAPFSSRNDTRASPVSSSRMASSVLNSGLARKVSAATLTAFWSRGV